MPTKKKLPDVMRGDTWPIRVEFSNLIAVLDGACSLSSPSKITSASAAFAAGSLDKQILLEGAGEEGGDYAGKITAIDSATQVTVAPVVETAVTGRKLIIEVPENISGNDLWFTLKNALNDPDPGVLQEKVTAPANAASAAGIAFLHVPSTKTINATPKTYFYDIQRTIPGTVPLFVETPIHGTITVIQHRTVAVV